MASIYNIRFEDFWHDFDVKNNFIVSTLQERFDIKVLVNDNLNPDILFYSNFGVNNLKWRDCIRIYVTGEADIPDFNLCDYAIGLAKIEFYDRYMRFPFYFHTNEQMLKIKENITLLTDQEAISRDFCSALISNTSRNPIVFEFYAKLNNYKRIASGGGWNNTVGGVIDNKYSFLNNYKFHIAFENEKIPGYVTEKILDSLIASSVPIYWGGECAKDDFNGRGFINISDFDNLDDALDFIIEVDNNNSLYLELLNRGRELKVKTFEDIKGNLGLFLMKAISSGKKIYNDHGVYKRLYDRQYLLYKIKSSRFQNIARNLYGWLKNI